MSERQLAANRANAARSTGPRTPEGKARSAQNSRKHGFASADFGVVRLEDLESLARLREDLISVYQPVNSQELFAIERMAIAQQSILRAARLEAGLFTLSLNEALDPTPRAQQPIVPMAEALIGDIETTRAQNRNYALARGFQDLTHQAAAWSLFLRYQAQAERQYRRALEEFERLKSLRASLPNEPNSAVIQHQVAHHPSDADVQPDGQSPAGDAAVPVEAPAEAAAQCNDGERRNGGGEQCVCGEDSQVNGPHNACARIPDRTNLIVIHQVTDQEHCGNGERGQHNIAVGALPPLPDERVAPC